MVPPPGHGLVVLPALLFEPPEPSRCSMPSTAREFMEQAPWMAVWPGLAIYLVVLGFNLLGDGLRDALDPRQS